MKADDEAGNNQARSKPVLQSGERAEQWVSGRDPMTPAQASYLKTLLEQAGDAESFDDNLTRQRHRDGIDALREELGLDEQGKRT